MIRVLVLMFCLCALAAPVQYVVQPGDTLSVIAEKTLGSGDHVGFEQLIESRDFQPTTYSR